MGILVWQYAVSNDYPHAAALGVIAAGLMLLLPLLRSHMINEIRREEVRALRGFCICQEDDDFRITTQVPSNLGPRDFSRVLLLDATVVIQADSFVTGALIVDKIDGIEWQQLSANMQKSAEGRGCCGDCGTPLECDDMATEARCRPCATEWAQRLREGIPQSIYLVKWDMASWWLLTLVLPPVFLFMSVLIAVDISNFTPFQAVPLILLAVLSIVCTGGTILKKHCQLVATKCRKTAMMVGLLCALTQIGVVAVVAYLK